MRNVNVQLFKSADISVNQTSPVVPIENMQSLSWVGVVTGTAAGSLQFQVSNDPGTSAQATNWANLGSATAVSGAATLNAQIGECDYRWLRATYAATSGTGALTLNLEAKGAS